MDVEVEVGAGSDWANFGEAGLERKETEYAESDDGAMKGVDAAVHPAADCDGWYGRGEERADVAV